MGQVAYRLTLPASSHIHPTFHVSQLKKHVGRAPHLPLLPLVGSDDELPKIPVRIVDRRMIKRGNQAIIEVLVEWANTFPEYSTWENFNELH